MIYPSLSICLILPQRYLQTADGIRGIVWYGGIHHWVPVLGNGKDGSEAEHSPRRNFLALCIFMLFQTILVEKEAFKGVFYRDSKRQQIHGKGDRNPDPSGEGV